MKLYAFQPPEWSADRESSAGLGAGPPLLNRPHPCLCQLLRDIPVIDVFYQSAYLSFSKV